jgi:hypothetical protein
MSKFEFPSERKVKKIDFGYQIIFKKLIRIGEEDEYDEMKLNRKDDDKDI